MSGPESGPRSGPEPRRNCSTEHSTPRKQCFSTGFASDSDTLDICESKFFPTSVSNTRVLVDGQPCGAEQTPRPDQGQCRPTQPGFRTTATGGTENKLRQPEPDQAVLDQIRFLKASDFCLYFSPTLRFG